MFAVLSIYASSPAKFNASTFTIPYMLDETICLAKTGFNGGNQSYITDEIPYMLRYRGRVCRLKKLPKLLGKNHLASVP